MQIVVILNKLNHLEMECWKVASKNILIVDDEIHILELLKYNLENNGYKVYEAETGEDAISILDNEEIDMALLDLMLPGIDGLEVLKYIRGNNNLRRLPVIMLTAKSEEIDKVVGLELGADDYIGKPFGIYELLARIKSLFRRAGDMETVHKVEQHKDNTIYVNDISINKDTRKVTKKNISIEMTLKEFELLYLLIQNRGRVFTRDYLLDKIWGYDYSGETRTVDVHIRNLRKKIEDDDKNPKFIKTLRGLGYKFSEKDG